MAELVGVARNRRWDTMLLWGFLGSLALIRAGHLEERDPYWQIRAGMENLAGVPLVRPDTWSWSGVPGDWYPNSPLWNILLAISYQAAGMWGFFLLSAATILLLFVMVSVLGHRLGARPLPGLLGLMVVFAAAFPMLNVRATLVVQILLLTAVQVALLLSDRAREASVAPLVGTVFAVAAGLSTLGNWVHLSFLVLGPALAVVWAVIWSLTPGLSRGLRVGLIASGAIGWVLGTLLSPYGVVKGLERTWMVQEACQGLIAEWASPFNESVPRQFVAIAAITLFVAGGTAVWVYRRWRAGGSIRDLAALAVIGVPAAVAGLLAIRFLGVALLTLAPVAAAAATRAADSFRARLGDWPASARVRAKLKEYSSGRFWRIVLSATLVVLSPGVVILGAQHGEPPEGRLTSQLPPGCKLFARPGFSAAVVLLRPDVPVWMDGRADFFGREMLILSYGYLGGTTAEIVPPGTSCVLLDVTADLKVGVEGRLRSSPDWRLADRTADLELWLPAGRP